MKVTKEQAGWYDIELDSGKKYLISRTGGKEYPWNTYSNGLSSWEFCTKTKKEALRLLGLIEKREALK